MESKQKRPLYAKKHHTGVLGAIFFSIFNLILLSLLSWVLLSVWFVIQVMLTDSESVKFIVQIIVESQQAIITHYFSEFHDSIAYLTQHMVLRINDGFKYNIGLDIPAILIGAFEIVLMRICLFIAFLPFMSVILFILIVDGLVQRDKRKFQGARESTFLFHRLKQMIQHSFLSLFLLYMIIPLNVSPEVCLLPMMILSGLFMMLSIKSFKKYL
jgi:hypothetical protein